MKVLFDTSVIIAAIIESHPKNKIALPWLVKAKRKEFESIISSHTIAELYAVLTTLPIRPRLSPSIAWRLINENVIQIAKSVSLTPKEYQSVIERLARKGIVGGAVYDAVIAAAAEKAAADQILTLNPKHFLRIGCVSEPLINGL